MECGFASPRKMKSRACSILAHSGTLNCALGSALKGQSMPLAAFVRANLVKSTNWTVEVCCTR
mgnify:CR=1 FL=1|jgi:hypothetical protein